MKKPFQILNIKRWARFAALSGTFLLCVSAHAATFTVDRTDDVAVSACSAAPNDCSLRGAVTEANAPTGADTIDFDATVFAAPDPHVIALATELPHLTSNVTITGPGPGANALTVKNADANQPFPIFTVDSGVSATLSDLTINTGGGIFNSGTVTVTNCTLSDNFIGINNYGGTVTTINCTLSGNDNGINNDNGTVTATGCTLSGNAIVNNGTGTLTVNNCSVSDTRSAGIYINDGTVTVTGCTLSGNFNYGIFNDGTLTVTNCTLSGNGFSGIENDGTVTVTNCTLSGNAYYGIENGGTLAATNCTFSGSFAGINNVGVENGGTLTVTNCTVSDNSFYGIHSNPNSNAVTLKNTLVAGNTTNVDSAFTDGGHNIVSGTAAQAGLDPAGLQDNGGPTKTIKLLSGSPAIDQGSSGGPATDQRGAARPFDHADIPNAPGGDGSDIGAFELFVPTLAVNNPRSLPEGSVSASGSITFNITLSAPSTQSVTVNYQTTKGSNNPATAGSDYVEKHGKLTFAPGETLKRVTVFFIGDSTPELNETFFFDLKTPTNATIFDGRGVGQINNDDGPSVSIANAPTVNEGNGDSTPQTQTFTVTLSAPSTDTVTVNYATVNGTAIGEQAADYTAASGTLTFNPGETTKTIVITLTGDTKAEPNETYKVSLSKPTYAVLSDALAVGIIRNDDATAKIFNDEPSS